MEPLLTALVPTCNRPRVLRRALLALAAAEGVELARVEVIVVDDGSAGEETPAVLRALGGEVPYRLVSLRQSRQGQAAARNLALPRARGRLLLFLNDDTIATPGLLAAHLAAHGAHPEPTAAVLGRVTLAPEVPRTPWRDLHLDRMWRRLRPGRPLEWHHFWTTNLSLKRSFLARTGETFDPAIRYLHDDTELGWRLRRHGLVLHYAPKALAYHDHPLALEEFLVLAEREARSLAYWARKDPTVVPALRRFGYGRRRGYHPLLDRLFAPALEPWWRRCVAALRPFPPLARLLLAQLYGARKRRVWQRLGASPGGA